MISSPNKHMEHLEDNVINNGVTGARESIKFLQSLRNMLSGDSNQAVNTTVKWDGAPAIIVGRKEGKLFVLLNPILVKTQSIISLLKILRVLIYRKILNINLMLVYITLKT